MNDFKKLLGRTIACIEGAEVSSERMTFFCTDDAHLTLCHY